MVGVQPVAGISNRRLNGRNRRTREDHRHSRAFADRMLEAGIGEKKNPELRRSDQQGHQQRRDQPKFHQRRAALITEHGAQAGHH
jgi:hypothetical protein